MLTELPRTIPVPEVGEGEEPPSGAGPDHPMRRVTHQVAFDPGGWTPERRAKVAALFDELAPEWGTRFSPGREAALADALDRGLDAVPGSGRGPALEVGSGTGRYSPLLADRFATVVALDLAWEMLVRAPADGPGRRVHGDASQAPFPDGAFDALVLMNALLFPAEVDRLLAPGGALVWVNGSGTSTPIHLTAGEVDRALPGEWDGVASEAGWGTWSVHWRSAT